MIILDDINRFKRLDKDRVSESIHLLADQIEQVWVDSKAISIPKDYKKKIDKVVVAGMGGSNLGFRIISSVFKDELKFPIIIESGYDVPAYVNKNTLYIISSYSGNTEEPLSTYCEVKKRGTKVLAITSKGLENKLADLMDSEKIPGFIFDPENNPSMQPRLGLGYSIFGAIRLLQKLGVLNVSSQTAREVVAGIRGRSPFWNVNVKFRRNKAKALAYKLYKKNIILVGAEFLEGNMHAFRNQINENSKNYASYLIAPDMNHYALEGLVSPGSLKKDFTFLFIDSNLYHERTKRRMALSKQAVKQNGIEVISYKLGSRIKLAQSFEILQFGTWVSYYLAILNNQNPADIKVVDWFKKQLR